MLNHSPDPGQETKAKMVRPCLMVFWFSKDNPTGHSERKKKKRQTEEEVERQYQRADRNGLGQLKTGQDGKGLLQIHLWCPNVLPRLRDRIECWLSRRVLPFCCLFSDHLFVGKKLVT